MPANQWQQMTHTQRALSRITYFFGIGFIFVPVGVVLLNVRLIKLCDLKTLLT